MLLLFEYVKRSCCLDELDNLQLSELHVENSLDGYLVTLSDTIFIFLKSTDTTCILR
jgi:hypothetical protein